MSRSAIRTSALVVALALWAVPAGAQRANQGDDDSAALVIEGRAALKGGALDSAAKALDQAIALNPRRIEAYVLRSAVYAARKQYKQGVGLMRRAQGLAPADEDVLTALGSHLVLSGDSAAGVPLLEQVIARNPLRYDAELLLGHHWYAIGRWPQAIAALEAYFVHRPRDLANDDGRQRVDLADAYLRDRQPAKALAAFQQVASEATPELRTRLGIAWATAAIDCRRARTLLRELEPVARAHPDVWLVDGRCALELGDIAGALERGRQYLERAGQGSAAGHALLGEAFAARGSLGDARRELEIARDREPAARRWTVRLAGVLRRSGEPRAALAILDELGAPPAPAGDPAWWVALGEALLATGDPTAVITRLTPVVVELLDDAAIRTVLGRALLDAGQAEVGVKMLEGAEAIASTPESRALLARALATAAVARLSAHDAAAAEPMLARAATLDESAAILRDLGIARLANDRPGAAIAAVTALDRAVELEPAPITLMLDARAHALARDAGGARALYERALDTQHAGAAEVAAGVGPGVAPGVAPEIAAGIAAGIAAEIAIDWAASELAGGDPAIAVTALERTAAVAAAGPLAGRHRVALAEAHHAAGVAALLAGNAAKAVELLKASLASEPGLAAKCDLALAEVVAGDATTSLAALEAVAGQRCPFPPPADLQAVPILIAFIEGLNPKRAGGSLERLTALAGKSSGPVAALLATAIRIVALEAAADAYRNGNRPQARRFLATARAANAGIGGDEVAHDLALLDVADGKLDAAIAALERLAAKLPDALVTLGVAYERKGDPVKALDAWRRARKAGSRFAQLAEWIDAKQLFYGESP
jgi:tetratricopeptide (TPR) repeat protein